MLHEFMGIITDVVTPDKNDRNIERSILTLALLDALIATYLTCFRDEGFDSVGGHRQKLNFDTFTHFSTVRLQPTDQYCAEIC